MWGVNMNMIKFIFFICIISGAFLIGLYEAFAVMLLWNWFIATSLSISNITLVQAFGIIFFTDLFKNLPKPYDTTCKNEVEMAEDIFKTFAKIIIKVTVILGFAGILLLFL